MKQFIRITFQSDIRRNAAALSYYFVSALIPLAILVTTVTQMVTGGEFLRTFIRGLFSARVGEAATESLVSLVAATQLSAGFSFFFLILVLYSVYCLYSLVAEVTSSLDTLINGRTASVMMERLKKIAITAAVFLAVIIMEALLPYVYGILVTATEIGDGWLAVLLTIVYRIISICISAAFFTSLYKLLADSPVSTEALLRSALLSAAGLAFVNILLLSYVALAASLTLYGASAFVIVFLLWTYLSAIVLYTGASYVSAEE